MPYKTIQQNFANGELNPKMLGRSDVEMYYKSARKMRDVVTTPYGGFARRPAMAAQAVLGETTARITDWSYSSGLLGGEPALAGDNDAGTYFVSDNAITTVNKMLAASQAQGQAQRALRKISVKNAALVTRQAQAHIVLTGGLYSVQIDDGGMGYDWQQPPQVLVNGQSVQAQVSISAGKITGITLPDGAEYAQTDTLAVQAPPRWEAYFQLKAQLADGSLESVGEPFLLNSEEEKTFFVDCELDADGVWLTRQEQQNMVFAGFKIAELNAHEYKSTLYQNVKLLPFVFNNEQAYVLALMNKTVKMYLNGQQAGQVNADAYTEDILPYVRYAQTADTAFLVHEDVRPMQLKRTGISSWQFGGVNFNSLPKYDFDSATPNQSTLMLTPDAMEGSIRLSYKGNLFEHNLVGQVIEANGGRIRITGQDSSSGDDHYFAGYTIIPLYSEEDIHSWTYTLNYEDVWSDERGWPASVTFHQGRLYFGGSKSRPQTVWGSKVGLYFNFDPTGGYDDDALEFTLDTAALNKITDLFSQRNLQIFTTGGEFICQTSYNEPITPQNVNAVKQTANGSWPVTGPVDLEGTVLFVERRGQALMNFVFDSAQEAYTSANGALLNSHLIEQPQDLAVERNNFTQQTNYIYIVNKDGSLCVVNVLLSQGISGGFTLWKTDGKIKSVCVLPDATYLAVERAELDGNKIYLEKLDWDALTDGAEFLAAARQNQFTAARFAGKEVDVLENGAYVGTYRADAQGHITAKRALTGTAEIGLPVRPYVESNFLELPQLGSGIGKKKRLAKTYVRTLDTPEITFNGQTLPAGEGVCDTAFYGAGDYDTRPTWKFTQDKPYKFNVLAMEMEINYETGGGE